MVLWPLSPQIPGPLCATSMVLDEDSAVHFEEGSYFFPSSIHIAELDHVC